MPTRIAAILGMGAQYGVILPYSREQELEADRLGLINMARGGYDPRQSVAFWQNMQRGEGGRPGFLSTHPAPGNRIAQLQQFMPEAMAAWQAVGRAPTQGPGPPGCHEIKGCDSPSTPGHVRRFTDRACATTSNQIT